jgi:hypothetical protein
MKVLIWACGFEKRFAGPFVYKEARRQGFDVHITGSREHPQQMLKALDKVQPDFVFCFALRPQLRPYYKLIRRSGAKLLFWYPDMTEHRRDRMWRRNLKDQADVLVFSILETANRYKDLAPVVLWMPQYFDHHTCSRAGELPTRLHPGKPIYDLCFIGSVDKLRQRWLRRLSQRYNTRFVVHTPGMLNEVRGWHMAEVYAQSRIAFNIQRQMFINPGPFVTSNRAYNAMGSGAFFINHQVQQLDLVWNEGIHCVTHNDSFSDLRSKIDYYLEHANERERIAACGRRNVLTYHTLQQRVKEYWSVMQMVWRGRVTPEWNNNFPGYGKWVQGAV